MVTYLESLTQNIDVIKMQIFVYKTYNSHSPEISQMKMLEDM